MPENSSIIISLRAVTKKGLKELKSITVHTAGTQSPKAMGIGNALVIEARMYLKSAMFTQSSYLPKSL